MNGDSHGCVGSLSEHFILGFLPCHALLCGGYFRGGIFLRCALEIQREQLFQNRIVAQVGGCDFLNTVFSLEQYGRYHDLRRATTKPDDPILPLAVSDEKLAATVFDRYAFHPGMTALHRLYEAGNVAVVLGAGLPAAEGSRLSHEAAKFDWHTLEVDHIDTIEGRQLFKLSRYLSQTLKRYCCRAFNADINVRTRSRSTRSSSSDSDSS